MNYVKNAHLSLLAFTHKLAQIWADTESLDFDAVADVTTLPNKDLIGLRSFALASGHDTNPIPITSGMIILMTYNDASNMRLMDRLNRVFNDLLPEQIIPLYDAQTETVIGEMKLLGVTRLMPLERNGNRAIQGITFQAGLQALS